MHSVISKLRWFKYACEADAARRQGAAFLAVTAFHVLIGAGFYFGLAAPLMKHFAAAPIVVREIAVAKEAVKPLGPLPLLSDVKIFVPMPIDTLRFERQPTEVTNSQEPIPTLEGTKAGPLPEPAALIATGVRMDPKHPLRIGPDYYPDAAVRANEEGRCTVTVTVGVDGRVSSPSLAASSGFRHLDDACLSAVIGQRMLPATENGKAVAKTTDIPIVWRLNGRH